MNTYNRKTPRSLTEARMRRRDLVSEIQTIEGQLGSKTRKEHLYADPGDYYNWRNNATIALNARVDELRYLNWWIDHEVYTHGSVALNDLRAEADGRDVIALTISTDGWIRARFSGENCDRWIEIAELGSFNLLDLMEADNDRRNRGQYIKGSGIIERGYRTLMER